MISKVAARLRRKTRVRMSISGSAQKPRISVFRSNKSFYAQAIDDVSRVTISAISSLKDKDSSTIQKVSELAAKFATDLKSKGIETIVFDRNGYKYHGKVKAFAEALREAGIIF